MRSMSSAQRQVELILLGNIIVTTRNINGSETVYFVIQDHLLYLFVKCSGGLTTGPLGPGPQAPELQGAPKFPNFFFLGHNH